MNEHDWNSAIKPKHLLEWLTDRVSERRLRLIAVAFCRRVERFLPDQRSHHAIEVAERFADGLANADELEMANEAAEVAAEVDDSQAFVAGFVAVVATQDLLTTEDVCELAEDAAMTVGFEEGQSALNAEQHRQADLIREIVGNPFQPMELPRKFCTESIMRMAQEIYEHRDFNRLPKLADKLSEVGYIAKDVLEHLREGGPHVRGCWALDLILGKR